MRAKELNEKAATLVMGWTKKKDDVYPDKQYYVEPGEWTDIFNPSSDISDAWMLVEKMLEKGWQARVTSRPDSIEHPWGCCFVEVSNAKPKQDLLRCCSFTKTAPAAITLAAIAAVEKAE